MDFIEQLVAELTGTKSEITVTEDEYGAIITIHAKDNVSLLIGKGGGTIDAIRTIVKALGYNGKHRIKLRINEQTSTQPSTGQSN